MIGRFLANGRLYEGKFEIAKNKLLFESLEFPMACIKFLPPVIPSKIVAVGLNYLDHAEELGMPIPEEPIIFFK
ncbi:MAG: 2-hydroxyhepta-2,4-diene-1,7-dioate isomerase, partial [Archaeoglobaceae archaeon]|nr:2-hydroxyhepta-2,4-diene-1,7-dioate isomerase [Archaeoglobaceae archaeon]MDW8128076.1 2-hydroxyhepta-2,4-diene-1,7-dioate isomerase [Archaeoglobaceae archaeon]